GTDTARAAFLVLLDQSSPESGEHSPDASSDRRVPTDFQPRCVKRASGIYARVAQRNDAMKSALLKERPGKLSLAHLMSTRINPVEPSLTANPLPQPVPGTSCRP